MNEPALHQGMKQQMVASQAMQTGIKILQAPAIELQQTIRQLVETNPMLEQEPEPALEELTSLTEQEQVDQRDDGWNEFTRDRNTTVRIGKTHDYVLESVTAHETLKEHLATQAGYVSDNSQERQTLLWLIDLLDARGIFTVNPQDLHELPSGTTRQSLAICLSKLRKMDPAGVGARDLQDSLLIQLEQKHLKQSLAYRIVAEHWHALAKHKYDLIARQCGVSVEQVQAALDTIQSLNPDPGAQFARQTDNPYIQPDVIVTQSTAGDFDIELTDAYIPKLTLNNEYMELMAESATDRELRQYLRKAFRDGQEVIHAIQQRQQTLLRLTQQIVARQREFFLKGPSHLKAMTMEEVATTMDVHVSTVSRACRDKFLSCRWGVRELRSFFSTGITAIDPNKSDLRQQNPATDAIYERIKQLIAAEPAASPLSDAKLAALLQQQGLNIARRTVAKYREQLKILPASLRKKG